MEVACAIGCAKFPFPSGRGEKTEAFVPADAGGLKIEQRFQTGQGRVLLEDIGGIERVGVVHRAEGRADGIILT